MQCALSNGVHGKQSLAGAKARHIDIDRIGTTEVVPFYKTHPAEFFRRL